MKKILIYGGTYNPIHLAHLEIIKEALKLDDFDRVFLVPNKFGHFKEDDNVTSEEDRLTMIELGLKERGLSDQVEICDFELKLDKQSYTYDLIKGLEKEYPDSEFYFLIGSDQAYKFHKWYKIDLLKKMVTFIIANRDEVYQSDEFLLLGNEPLHYNSTMIRNDYESTGLSSVDKYIRENGLYLEEVVNKRLSYKRARHSSNVAKLACEIAALYDIDVKKAYIAGMLHDITKEMPEREQLALFKENEINFEVHPATLHAFSGAIYVKKVLKITDEEILDAIRWHTTAYLKMSKLAKLIYVCDMLSDGREFSGIEHLRKELTTDLDDCFKACFMSSYEHLVNKNLIISPELNKLMKMIKGDEV